jgi:hypothetical protein
MVSLAMRFADEGHNRDVLFGVLLGRRCEARRAAQIADSVAALQAARREAAKADLAAEAERAEGVEEVQAETEAAATSLKKHAATTHEAASPRADQGKREEPASDAHPAGALGSLWFQFLNGLRF